MDSTAGQASGDAPQIEPEGRTDAERRYLARLQELSSLLHIDIWVDRQRLVTSVDIRDDTHNLVLRTLRVDFDGRHVWGGNDLTHQLASDLDPDDPDWFERRDGKTPEECAETAAAFFAREAARPIEREEWVSGATTRYRWTLADVGRRIVTQGSIPTVPPTRVSRVSPAISRRSTVSV